MFGKDRGSFGPPSAGDNTQNSSANLLELADEAFLHGDLAQAAHLYLAAFDASATLSSSAYQPAIDGLRKAWKAALQLKDRALAEHIFEKLEDFSSSDEVAENAEALQRLALDKLEEFGFSREDLQDMADMVSEDFINAAKDAQSPDSTFAHVLSVDSKAGRVSKGVLSWPPPTEKGAPEKTDEQIGQKAPEECTYADLVGFDRAISEMNKRGIGLAHDESFTSFMDALSKRHGIHSLPANETLLIRSLSREDANQFLLATAKELGVPGVRMFVEETPMGFPVLCILATPEFKMNPARGGFTGPGVLLLEDIDMWGEPFSSYDDMDGTPYYMQLTRGARDALMFIRSAVDNPDVQVIASASHDFELDEFFLNLLEPISEFELDLPNVEERESIWQDVYHLYPSVADLKSDDIIRLSANLSRFDIYLAAREAVDQAFKESVEARRFIPVTRDNLYNKISSFQALDSKEYQELEETAIETLRLDLDTDTIDDRLKGNE